MPWPNKSAEVTNLEQQEIVYNETLPMEAPLSMEYHFPHFFDFSPQGAKILYYGDSLRNERFMFDAETLTKTAVNLPAKDPTAIRMSSFSPDGEPIHFVDVIPSTTDGR